jgi:cytochrome c553
VAVAVALACASAAAAADPPGKAKARACIPCHGALGVSVMPDAPHLAAQPAIYVVQQLKAFRSGARKHEVMNVIAKPLSDADIAELAEWFASVAIEAREKR